MTVSIESGVQVVSNSLFRHLYIFSII